MAENFGEGACQEADRGTAHSQKSGGATGARCVSRRGWMRKAGLHRCARQDTLASPARTTRQMAAPAINSVVGAVMDVQRHRRAISVRN